MSISSISAPAPVSPPDPGMSRAPDPQTDNDASDSAPAQPPAQAALPPGQGTRVDQLV
jgi:hypothetical protein